MHSRPVISPLLALLVLNLGFTAQESRCVAGSKDPVPASSAHHTGRHQPVPDHQGHNPAIPVCCQALPSCSATIASGRPMVSLENCGAHRQLAPAAEPVALSNASAPDTPPPRE